MWLPSVRYFFVSGLHLGAIAPDIESDAAMLLAGRGDGVDEDRISLMLLMPATDTELAESYGHFKFVLEIEE